MTSMRRYESLGAFTAVCLLAFVGLVMQLAGRWPG
jgi:hypothetical protein